MSQGGKFSLALCRTWRIQHICLRLDKGWAIRNYQPEKVISTQTYVFCITLKKKISCQFWTMLVWYWDCDWISTDQKYTHAHIWASSVLYQIDALILLLNTRVEMKYWIASLEMPVSFRTCILHVSRWEVFLGIM